MKCRKRWTTIVNVDFIRFPLCSGVSCLGTHLAHNFMNNTCSGTILCNKEREITDDKADDEFRSVLCSVHPILYHRPHITVGAGIRSTILKHCHDPTVRTSEVPLMHASCDVIVLSLQASRNKWFNSCGTRAKLTLRTPLVLKIFLTPLEPNSSYTTSGEYLPQRWPGDSGGS